MTLRVVTPVEPPLDRPRDSASVQVVAKILGCDDSEVRRLVVNGSLEGFTLGKRAIRIFLDSVSAYQVRQSRPVTAAAAPAIQRRAVTHAAHEAATRRLREAGFLD